MTEKYVVHCVPHGLVLHQQQHSNVLWAYGGICFFSRSYSFRVLGSLLFFNFLGAFLALTF
jgi:hypothetical protein